MINTKQIKTSKTEILVIGGLPEDTGYVELLLGDLFYAKEEGDWGLSVEHNMPPGKWESVGFLDKIPEDVAKELVATVSLMGEERYNNYHLVFGGMHGEWFIRAFNTAKESIVSLVEANCKLENKYGDKPKSLDEYVRRSEDSNGLSYIDPYQKAFYDRYLEEFKSEQEKVFTNPYLLRKIS